MVFPANQEWFMDSSATSHMTSNNGNLPSSFSFPSSFGLVILGDGSTLPITHTGHLVHPTPTKPLQLRNTLVVPRLIKNLVYVQRFTADSNRSLLSLTILVFL